MTSRVEQQGGEPSLLVVRDHGPGIPPEAREHLFERFWRREGGRERGRAGAGLGLAIVHGVVGAHHGTISVGDAPGAARGSSWCCPPRSVARS